jgi:hypothetical protein
MNLFQLMPPEDLLRKEKKIPQDVLAVMWFPDRACHLVLCLPIKYAAMWCRESVSLRGLHHHHRRRQDQPYH